MAENKSEIKERLIALANELGVTTKQLSIDAGKNNEYINKITGSIGSDAIRQIYLKHPSINIHWLITGEGTMFQEQSNDNHEYISFANLINEYRLDIKELNNQIKELEKQKAELEQKLIQAKKHVLEEEDVTCANASGFNLAK